MQFRHSALFLVFMALSACSPRMGDTGDPGTDPGTGTPPGSDCKAGEGRCIGNNYETCSGGKFTTARTCAAPSVCSDSLGCVACRPERLTCSGDELHVCRADGTIGEKTQVCGPGQCQNGACLANNCAAGSDLIYLVDQTYNLLSLDPKDNKNEPKSIGRLSCPARPSLEDASIDATPFSMSVGRDGTAWVLYTSGEIFFVSTKDASCKPSGFKVGQRGMELFGMGFVSNGNGAMDETLFITGGAASGAGTTGLFASVDPAMLNVTMLGSVKIDMQAPELTGNGKGELWAYFPGTSSSKVARLNKANGASDQEWKLPGLGGSVSAWAFAHWGGRYYIFVTTGSNSTIRLFDPATGMVTTLRSNLGNVIVGAGVSTCAPVILG